MGLSSSFQTNDPGEAIGYISTFVFITLVCVFLYMTTKFSKQLNEEKMSIVKREEDRQRNW